MYADFMGIKLPSQEVAVDVLYEEIDATTISQKSNFAQNVQLMAT